MVVVGWKGQEQLRLTLAQTHAHQNAPLSLSPSVSFRPCLRLLELVLSVHLASFLFREGFPERTSPDVQDVLRPLCPQPVAPTDRVIRQIMRADDKQNTFASLQLRDVGESTKSGVCGSGTRDDPPSPDLGRIGTMMGRVNGTLVCKIERIKFLK